MEEEGEKNGCGCRKKGKRIMMIKGEDEERIKEGGWDEKGNKKREAG